MRILAMIALCVTWTLIGSQYHNEIHQFFNEKTAWQKKAEDLKTEMEDKVEILGEKTVELHDKLKRCLDEKFKCDCGRK